MEVRLAIHHVALRARDLEATVAFYVALCGLAEVRDERPRSVWLGLEGGAVLMVEARGGGEPDVPQGSLDLIAFRVAAERRRAIGAAARGRGCFDGETAHTVYL